MKARVAFLSVVLCIAFGGCAATGLHTSGAGAQGATKTTDTVHRTLAALESRNPRGTRVYETDSVIIQDGDDVAQFNAAARVTRTASAVSVYDVESGQTFTFSAGATVSYTSGTSRVYVPPGSTAPAWLRQAHVRTERTL